MHDYIQPSLYWARLTSQYSVMMQKKSPSMKLSWNFTIEGWSSCKEGKHTSNSKHSSSIFGWASLLFETSLHLHCKPKADVNHSKHNWCKPCLSVRLCVITPHVYMQSRLQHTDTVYALIQAKQFVSPLPSVIGLKQDCEQDYTANCIGNCCMLWSFSRQVSAQSAAHERSSHWVLGERAAYDVTNQKRTLTSNKDQSQWDPSTLLYLSSATDQGNTNDSVQSLQTFVSREALY